MFQFFQMRLANAVESLVQLLKQLMRFVEYEEFGGIGHPGKLNAEPEREALNHSLWYLFIAELIAT